MRYFSMSLPVVDVPRVYRDNANYESETLEVIVEGSDDIDTLLQDLPIIEPRTSSPVDSLTTVLPDPSTRRRLVTPELPNPPRKKKKPGAELLADSLGRIAEAVTPQRSWKEMAIDLWKDIVDSEDIDLQLEAVDALRDEAIAILFCKIPPGTRQRRINRLRNVE
jgi:hypothetical protein